MTRISENLILHLLTSAFDDTLVYLHFLSYNDDDVMTEVMMLVE